ncbi:hypothetical protein VNO77_44587 [Canavalia gladiata]|uniref:Uncharacterized protein n=1 Tax=Canavalia gladiata TaxID=3824 RepID=A0AAN9PQG8_CANGL
MYTLLLKFQLLCPSFTVEGSIWKFVSINVEEPQLKVRSKLEVSHDDAKPVHHVGSSTLIHSLANYDHHIACYTVHLLKRRGAKHE